MALDLTSRTERLKPHSGDAVGVEGQNVTSDEFRETMVGLNLTNGALARMFVELGDMGAPNTIRRRVSRWADGGANVPGEVTAFLTVLSRFPDVLATLRAEVAIRQEPDDDC